MNSDARVMEYYPNTLTAAESDAMIDRIEETFSADGLGLWAVEIPETAPFIGYVGLWPARFPAPFTPAIEVGWRLAAPYWGRGYATDAARVAIEDGFSRLHLDEIVSFTAHINLRSRRVMEKLGMTRDPREDFDHPNVPEGHRLRPHVLYRLNAGW
jgi:RimJ/RimL family protein N-acetyltransferase